MPVLEDLISYDVAYHLRQAALYDEPEHERMAEALLALKSERLVEIPLSYEEDESLAMLEHCWHEERYSLGRASAWAHHTPLLPLHYAALEHQSVDHKVSYSWHATLPLSLERLEWLGRMVAEVRAGSIWSDWSEARHGPIIDRLLARARAVLLPAAPPFRLDRVLEISQRDDVELEA